jgi:hypothetical protein
LAIFGIVVLDRSQLSFVLHSLDETGLPELAPDHEVIAAEFQIPS